jgi:hypothetical protein
MCIKLKKVITFIFRKSTLLDDQSIRLASYMPSHLPFPRQHSTRKKWCSIFYVKHKNNATCFLRSFHTGWENPATPLHNNIVTHMSEQRTRSSLSSMFWCGRDEWTFLTSVWNWLSRRVETNPESEECYRSRLTTRNQPQYRNKRLALLLFDQSYARDLLADPLEDSWENKEHDLKQNHEKIKLNVHSTIMGYRKHLFSTCG